MKTHLPITQERYAVLRARLDQGEPLDRVLADARLSEKAWRAAENGWLARIGADVAQKRFGLAQRYQEAYLAERPELTGQRAAPRPRAVRHVPPSEPRIEPPPPAIPAAMRGLIDVQATQAASGDKPKTLPFAAIDPQAMRAPAPSPALKIPRAMMHFADVGATKDAPPVAPVGAALPFAPPPQEPPPSSEGVPKAMRHFVETATTQDAPAAPPSASLPFTAARTPAEPRVAPPAALPQALPFSPALSLEHWVCLCIDVERAPASTPAILQRYGITPEQRVRLDAHWRARIAADPRVRAAWQAFDARRRASG